MPLPKLDDYRDFNTKKIDLSGLNDESAIEILVTLHDQSKKSASSNYLSDMITQKIRDIGYTLQEAEAYVAENK